MKRMLGIILSGLLVAFASVGGAMAADWSVVRTSGNVVIKFAGAQPASLTSGESLPVGGVLATGGDGRAMLVRGEEQMIVGPNSVIAIPAGSNDQFTTILQQTGVVEFTVEKRNVQHFSVETPYLAAVVKGTHFVVGAFDTTGAVKVARGKVEVTALDSGQVTDVTAGQTAQVRAGGALSISGVGRHAPILQSTPRPDLFEQAAAGTGAAPAVPAGTADREALASIEVGSDGVGASIGGVADVNVGGDGVDVGVDGVVDLGVGSSGLSIGLGSTLGGLLGQ